MEQLNNLSNRFKVIAAVGLVLVAFSYTNDQTSVPTSDPATWQGVRDETPVMNLPYLLRTWNWGGGSCVHASTINCLRWQGQDALADWWRKLYVGGESYSGLTAKLQKSGIYWAGTYQGDVEFLEWACRTRRGAIIFYYPNHSVNLVHLDANKAYLLDNNRPKEYIPIDRKEFIYNWKSYGGVAVTPVCSPAPPLPWVKQLMSSMGLK